MVNQHDLMISYTCLDIKILLEDLLLYLFSNSYYVFDMVKYRFNRTNHASSTTHLEPLVSRLISTTMCGQLLLIPWMISSFSSLLLVYYRHCCGKLEMYGVYKISTNDEREGNHGGNCGKLHELHLPWFLPLFPWFIWVKFPREGFLSFFTKFRKIVFFQFFHSKFPDVFCKICHFWRFFTFCSILVSFWISMGF
jgi:hypothetical protein